MKKVFILIVSCLIITVIIISIRISKSIDKNLILAEKLMSDHPDSSLQVLEKLNTNDLAGENKALYALLMTQAQFKNYKPVESDSLIKIAYEYFVPGKDSLRKSQSCFYQGRVDQKMGKYNDAIRNFQKASISALSLKNYDLLSLIYNRWGLLLDSQSLYNDALIVQNKSLKYAILNKDTLKQYYVYKSIGSIYSVQRKFDQALVYYDKAMHLAYLTNNTDGVADVCKSIGLIYRCKGNYDLALYYVDKSLSLLKDTSLLFRRYLLKGDLFTLKGKYDTARYYINLGRCDNNLSSKASYCSLMGKLNERIGNYKEALLFSNKYIDYIYKIIDTDREKAIAELQRKYDYSLIKNENDKLKISRQQMQIVILAISLIAIIATFLFLYYYYRKRSIKRTMKLELDKMQRDLMNEKSNYFKEKTIEAQRNLIKEKELSMELSQRTEALKQHQERERELKDYIFQMEAIVQKINTFNSMKPLQRSKSESQFALSFQELNDLEEAVNLCFDHFADRLRAEFPKLKDDDIHLCCLLKMKVPNKNILSLLDTNEMTLKKRRYRIKHDKMNLPDDVSSLEEFLLNY